MLTRIAPTLAVAYWVNTHSAQFGAQMPTRSPLPMPAPTRPRASRSTSAPSSAYVIRRPVARSTSASRSGTRATVASRLSPMVCSSRAGVSLPTVCDRAGSGVSGAIGVLSGCGAGSAPANTPAGSGASARRGTGCPVARPPARCAQPGVGRDKRSSTPSRSASRSGSGQASSRALTGAIRLGRASEPSLAREAGGGEQAGEALVVERGGVDRRRAARRARGRPRPDRRRARHPPTRRSATTSSGTDGAVAADRVRCRVGGTSPNDICGCTNQPALEHLVGDGEDVARRRRRPGRRGSSRAG